jgi:hypothetical protein
MSVRVAETDRSLCVALQEGSAVEHARAEQSAISSVGPPLRVGGSAPCRPPRHPSVLGNDDCCGSQAHG